MNPIERAATPAQATNFYYDKLDRLYLRSEPDLTSYWVYDQWPSAAGANPCAANSASVGKLVEAFTWTGTITTTSVPTSASNKDYDRVACYDNVGRPSTSATTRNNKAITYTSISSYDGYGRVSRVTHQAGSNAPTKTYEQYYNGNGYLAQVARVDTVANSTKVLWQANGQDAADRVTLAALGNGLAIDRSYNPNTARLTDAALANAGGTQVLFEGYGYDVLGNVNSRTQYWNTSQNGFTESFTYDGMNRLWTSQVTTLAAQSPQTFLYDDIGDITSKTGVGTGGLGSYHYGGLAAGCSTAAPTPAVAAGPHAVTRIDGLGSFCYDANGNMLSGNGRTTSWNSFDMPVTITGSASSSTFVYGPEHQRTKQTRGDGTVILYADAMEIDTLNGNTTVKTYWPMGLGVEIDAANTTTLNWTHTDRLGSIVAVTDQSGNLAEPMAYDAWGARRDLAGDPAVLRNYQEKVDNKGFTGQEELDKLALVHLNGRIYDPFVARFISADPLIQDPTHSQSYNRYTYVWNNPTNFTDPTGFKSISETMHDAWEWSTIFQAGDSDDGSGSNRIENGVANKQGDTSNGAQATSAGIATAGNPGDKQVASCPVEMCGSTTGKRPRSAWGNISAFFRQLNRSFGVFSRLVPNRASFASGSSRFIGGPCSYNCVEHDFLVGQTTDVMQGAGQGFAEGANGYYPEVAKMTAMSLLPIEGAAEDLIVLFKNRAPNDLIDIQKLVPNERLSGISGNFNYVVTEDGSVVVGRSGHTSLSGGSDVQAAGELQLYNGRAKWVDNNSGHYQPSGAGLSTVVEKAFNSIGVDATGKFIYRTFP